MSKEACDRLKERIYRHSVRQGKLPTGKEQRLMERKAVETAEREDRKAEARRH